MLPSVSINRMAVKTYSQYGMVAGTVTKQQNFVDPDILNFNLNKTISDVSSRNTFVLSFFCFIICKDMKGKSYLKNVLERFCEHNLGALF